ncbi:ABC transporter ATP-binding protein [Chromatiales bacterium (ex Bugula neritina AB1)]|nr:ABC transporter ATP-binding protein [Chromatiales bacterium (ex Bugula neritina AB1)]
MDAHSQPDNSQPDRLDKSFEQPWLDPAATPFIEVKGVSKSFGNFTAVDNIDLQIFRGELFVLLGGSGCGKTTLLRMLAGFEMPSSGTLSIDGADMTTTPPYDRPVNMMFQSYALFPHMTVEKNVAYGLKRDGVARAEIAQRVDEMLQMVELQDFRKRKPNQLSGGQRQRVALARALIKRPKVLLLDEPLGALDKRLREQTQFELMNLQDKLGTTFIVVTHDQEEAMTLATRIAVMDQGRFRQIGTPAEIYETPATKFIAGFIGSANMLEGTVASQQGGTVRVDIAGGGFSLQVDHENEVATGTVITVAVRPEKIQVSKQMPEDAENVMQGTVKEMAYLGRNSTLRVAVQGGHTIEVNSQNQHRSRDGQHQFDWDDQVYVCFPAVSAVLLTS